MNKINKRVLVVISLVTPTFLILTVGVPTIVDFNNQLTNLTQQLNTLQTQKTDLQIQLTNTQEQLGTTQAKLNATQKDLKDTETNLQSYKATNTELQTNITEAQASLRSKANEIETLQNTILNQQQSLSILSSKLKNLDIPSLQSEAQQLQRTIDSYKKEREALVPSKTIIAEFRCTGSMEPTITCMDTGTFMTEPTPSDIVVGSIIVFDNPNNIYNCRPEITGTNLGHRVISIDVKLNGNTYYKTKGDANPTDDGCWIPSKAVKEYLLTLTKGYDNEISQELEKIKVITTKDPFVMSRFFKEKLEILVCEKLGLLCPKNIPPGYQLSPYQPIPDNYTDQLDRLRHFQPLLTKKEQ